MCVYRYEFILYIQGILIICVISLKYLILFDFISKICIYFL